MPRKHERRTQITIRPTAFVVATAISLLEPITNFYNFKHLEAIVSYFGFTLVRKNAP